ncbi:GNAT family N-acetyltransferase [Solicola sp. PLA-1-18]|uniref:GNAT family N-acetyltransferase n=1 Tax=Solicola sp. PLA-1-18 TaxID=3380532 RepID=UPI003B78FD70
MPVDPYLQWMIGTSVESHPHRGATVHVVTTLGRLGLVALGDVADQADAVGEAVRALRADGRDPLRASVHPGAADDVTVWDGPPTAWEWMLHDGRPVETPRGVAWLAADRSEELTSLIADHSPTAHARPGDPDVRGWAGVVVDDVVVATGAVVDSPAAWPHLRAIVTHPSARGRGLGTAVTAFLTADALRRAGACSLSMYSHNDGARRLYERLGYRTVRRFASAPVSR